MTKKHKFNIIDAIIIIVVAGIIAGVAFFLLRDKPTEEAKETVSIEYVVKFSKVRNELKDKISKDDTVVDSVAKYHIGKVVAVNAVDAVFANGNNIHDGTVVAGTYPGYSDVSATITAEAEIIGGRYVISGGYNISVGSRVDVRTPNYNGTGYCVSIRESEAE